MGISKTKQEVLNCFECRTDNWTFGDFEVALKKAMGKNYINYQTAKGAIREAHDSGLYPKTVKRYLLTNYVSLKSPIGGFEATIGEYLKNMTQEEKKFWGIM